MRQEVKWFAERMELTLALHDEKKGSDGWKDADITWLFELLEKEVRELGIKVNQYDHEYLQSVGVMKECFDVANFAMMIADMVR